MEQMDYNLRFCRFVRLPVDDPVSVPTVFTKNRDRLLEGDIAAVCFSSVLNQPQVRTLMSDELFSVDGTLIKACNRNISAAHAPSAAWKSTRPLNTCNPCPEIN